MQILGFLRRKIEVNEIFRLISDKQEYDTLLCMLELGSDSSEIFSNIIFKF